MKKEKSKNKPARIEEPSVPFIAWDLSHAFNRINEGLGTGIITMLQARLGLSNMELSSLLLISPRTLDRRKKESVLPPDESERTYRIARLTDLAAEVFGTMEKGTQWLKQPNYSLGNRTPIEFMKTEPGARLVERTLRQIEHGISA